MNGYQLEKVAPSFRYTGTVVHGEKLGRTIGFPTANIAAPPEDADLKPGVYYGYCEVVTDDPQENKQYHCLAYYGPKFVQGEHHDSFEVYLYDFDGDLYGATLVTVLTDFLRPPKKIRNMDALKLQIQHDKEQGDLIRTNRELQQKEQNEE